MTPRPHGSHAAATTHPRSPRAATPDSRSPRAASSAGSPSAAPVAEDRPPAGARPTDAGGPTDPLGEVGPHLRSLRIQRDATLQEVSEATGVSVSTLSRLESGGRRPSLELLLPLARLYGVSLDELVDAPATGDPRIHMRPVRREGLTMVPLTHRPGGIQAVKMIFEPGPGPGPGDRRVHEGYEWFYVLHGRLRVILGEHDLVLGQGEAAEFDCRTPHWFGAAGEESVEVLSLFGPQGEKAHLRARPKRRGSAEG